MTDPNPWTIAAMLAPIYEFTCENGHHTRTRSLDYPICTAQSQSVERGVYGPICGAEIWTITLCIEDFEALVEGFEALVGEAVAATEARYAALVADLTEYIEFMEDTVCGEFHTSDWPDCDDNVRHAEGRRLLAVLAVLTEEPLQ